METELHKGEVILNAVERAVARPDVLVARMRETAARHRHCRDATAKAIVSRYSNESAVVGGAAALPAVIPGVGWAAFVGTTLAEMVYVMKLEVEMCMELCALHDMDITDPRHRQVALLLAAVATHRVDNPGSTLGDISGMTIEALSRNAPRNLSKGLVDIFAKVGVHLAARRMGVGLLRAVPVVGVGVGASMNKLFTMRVGALARKALEARASMRSTPAA